MSIRIKTWFKKKYYNRKGILIGSILGIGLLLSWDSYWGIIGYQLPVITQNALQKQNDGMVKGVTYYRLNNVSNNVRKVSFKMKGRAYHYRNKIVAREEFKIKRIKIYDVYPKDANCIEIIGLNYVKIPPHTTYELRIEGIARQGEAGGASQIPPKLKIDEPRWNVIKIVCACCILIGYILDKRRKRMERKKEKERRKEYDKKIEDLSSSLFDSNADTVRQVMDVFEYEYVITDISPISRTSTLFSKLEHMGVNYKEYLDKKQRFSALIIMSNGDQIKNLLPKIFENELDNFTILNTSNKESCEKHFNEIRYIHSDIFYSECFNLYLEFLPEELMSTIWVNKEEVHDVEGKKTLLREYYDLISD